MRNNYNEYKILFVDDEEKTVKYFEKIYSREFSILVSSNASDAKKMLDEHSEEIAVLLTDQRMPGEKGTDLLSYSRQHYPHVIRLLTTAYSELEDAVEAVNKGEILRYLTKPWDINVLQSDLKYAMNFFLMRNERDQLLKEKLNVKQRLVELNRVRDLIIMSSGFTHLRNPLHAISSFLLQLPNLKQSHIADIQSLDVWGLMEKEIIAQLNIANELIENTNVDNSFEHGSIEELTGKVITGLNNNAELKIISSPIIEYNSVLIEKMLNGILKLLVVSSSGEDQLKVSIEAVSDGGKITIYGNNNDIQNATLLNVPLGLLTAFFICYHHGGHMVMDATEGLIYEITLPANPENTQFKELDDSWLENIFERFEQWPD